MRSFSQAALCHLATNDKRIETEVTMQMGYFGAATLMLASLMLGSTTMAANPHGIKLNPGERLVAIDGVPVDQLSAKDMPAVTTAGGKEGKNTDGEPVATNIVGNLVRSGQSFSHSDGVTALDKANAERRREGQRALIPDAGLQALALRKATIAAQRGYKNHIGGSLGGAKCEGVGYTNGRFLSCCLDEPGTYGGAAMVQGRDGWYCCLLVR
ncbi:hypothetical protein [Aeoliella sp. SH292]|uniref:hypothetical protein n=1 Tax=Aeoliella sp. SH292 TaxID=3454464 RepID=UPI003F99F9A2